MPPNLALVPLPSRPTAPVPLMSHSSVKRPRCTTSPTGATYLKPRFMSPSTWSSAGLFAASLFAYAMMDPYASSDPAPSLASVALSDSVPPTWFIVSLVSAAPPFGFGHAYFGDVQRKPPENHSVVKPMRNWPGVPFDACCVLRRPVPPLRVFDSLIVRSRSAHSAACVASSSSPSAAGAAGAPAAGGGGTAPMPGAVAAAGGAGGGVAGASGVPPPNVTVPPAWAAALAGIARPARSADEAKQEARRRMGRCLR